MLPASDAYTLLQERHGIDPVKCVYVGNAEEDVAFGENTGLPVVIVGKPFKQPGEATFIEEIPALVRTLRKHTDGASLFRIAIKNTDATFEPDSALSRNMSPAEMQAMVASGLRKFWSRHLTQSVDAYASSAWSHEYPSLKNIENFIESFGSVMGDIRVDQISKHPQLVNYFTDERIYQVGNRLGLRGQKYFTCVDKRMTANDQVATMMDELSVATTVIETTNRHQLGSEDLLSYLGVLDNAKQQALSLFHAYTYDERRQGIPDDSQYSQIRTRLLDVATRSTRSFFEACMGRTFTTPLSAKLVEELAAEISRTDIEAHPKGLKLQELDHPIKIMLAAYNLAREQPADTVVGFPSGGSQIAIATALASEILHDLAAQTTKVICIPLSQHSGTTESGATPISDALLATSVEMFRKDLENKHVMIVDDNSSTGTTIIRGTQAIERLRPASIRSGVGELDPQRTLVRARLNAQSKTVVGAANMEHALFEGVSGIVPMSRNDIQLRKEYAGRVLGLLRWRK